MYIILVLGDSRQRILAYMNAKTHGLEDDAADLKSELETDGYAVPTIGEDATKLVPPKPVNKYAFD